MKQTMKKKLILDYGDVEQIIADSFGVDVNNVDIDLYTDIEGYGMNEQYVAKIKVTVEVPMDKW